MLTPKTIADLPDDLAALTEDLQDDIVASISKKLTKADYLTPSAEWQLYKANQLRLSSKEVAALIAKYSGKSKRELKNLYTEACTEAINADAKIYREMGKDASSFLRSVAFSNALKAGIKNANGLLSNLCRTAASTATGAFERYLNKAYSQVLSGAFTLQEATYNAVHELAESGLKTIRYPSGHLEQMDVAMRRGVVTGIGQTTGRIQLDLAEKMGCDLVEVTSHLGARPSHAAWQGGIFSISGKSSKYPKLSEATGYGTGAGLKGWNCRHDFFPFFEGISKPSAEKFDSEENRKEYENSQKQRTYERTIRATKRKLIAYDSAISETSDAALKLKLTGKFSRTSVTLKRQEQGLKAFLKTTRGYNETTRTRVDGFGRSISGRAVHANKKMVEKSELSAILKDVAIKPVPITQKSISNVKLIKVKTFSVEQNKLLQKAHRQLLRDVMPLPAGTEAVAYYNMDLKLLGTNIGEMYHVDGMRLQEFHIAMHNHPSGLLFSEKDISTFILNGNMQLLSAVGNNGSVHLLQKGEAFDASGYFHFISDVLDKNPGYKNDINIYLKSMAEVLKGAKDYGIQYIR